MIHRLRAISTFLMLLLGAGGIAFGIYSETQSTQTDPLIVTIVSIAGSALFGASLTMFIDRMLGTDLMDIKSYLFQSEKFESAPDYLDQIAGVWHHYDLSEKDGSIYWQYIVFDYDKDKVSNTLRAQITNYGHDGTPQKYDVTAGYRNGSFVSFMRARDSSEKDSIEIIPGILNRNLKAHLGIQFLETWDGTSAFTYSIVARTKLVPSDKLSDSDQKFLFAELQNLIATYKINPIVSDQRLNLGA